MSEALNPFIARGLRIQEQQKAEHENAFGVRALKQFCKMLQVDIRTIERESEFGFAMFHREYPRFPIRLGAKRVELDLPKIIRDLPNSWLWKTYFEQMEQTSCEKFGLIVPLGKGFYVTHNDWDLRWAPGFTRIMHKGNNNLGIIVESLESFVASVSQVYTL
jgi:hypothetical protein